MRFDVLTLFPEMITDYCSQSIIKRAAEAGVISVNTINPRDFTLNKHKKVDDTPYGGGAGMVLMPQPYVDAYDSVCKLEKSITLMMTPQGERFHQGMARSFAIEKKHLIILCGHYEGFDERIRSYVDMEVSLGDFVLTGGEGAALVISDAIIRLLDDVIRKESHADDSFENGLLEYPQYTRPVEYDGKKVPDVLLSGHHANINRWRLKQSLLRTMKKRPDLLKNREFSKEETILMEEIKREIE